MFLDCCTGFPFRGRKRLPGVCAPADRGTPGAGPGPTPSSRRRELLLSVSGLRAFRPNGPLSILILENSMLQFDPVTCTSRSARQSSPARGLAPARNAAPRPGQPLPAEGASAPFMQPVSIILMLFGLLWQLAVRIVRSPAA